MYIENIFEELDEPGEWYLDADARVLYYMVNGTHHPPPPAMWATRLASLISVEGHADSPVCMRLCVSVCARVRVCVSNYVRATTTTMRWAML